MSDFSGLMSSICALAKAAAKLLMDWLDRCMVGLPGKTVKADGARFGPLGPNAMANRLLGILWHKALKFDLGLLVLEMRGFRPRITPQRIPPRRWTRSYRQSAQLRSAALAARQRTTVGGSPFSTQRQNFRSAVTTEC